MTPISTDQRCITCDGTGQVGILGGPCMICGGSGELPAFPPKDEPVVAIACPGAHRIVLTKEEADAIMRGIEESERKRAESMPDVHAALLIMFSAWQRLKELGWREAMYCPKDGSEFEVIEAGSTGIHVAHYHGEWPNGWWIASDGDLWPSHPILWRPKS